MIDIPDGHTGLTIQVARNGRVWVNDATRCILRAGWPAVGAEVRVSDDRADGSLPVPRPAPRSDHRLDGVVGQPPPTYESLADAGRDLRDAVMTLCAVGLYLHDNDHVAEGRCLHNALAAVQPLRKALGIPTYDQDHPPKE